MASYYKSIEELPIYNFNKIISTGELKFLVKKGSINDNAPIVWDFILNEFTEYVGFSKSYQDYMRFKREEALLICRAYLEEKKYLLNFAKIAELQAEDRLSTDKEDFDKSVALVSKHMGFRIDTKIVTVKEFYSYINILKDGKEEDRA